MDRIPETPLPSAGPASGSEEALCDFLLLLRSDDALGLRRPLREYLTRFPELEEEVAREYLVRADPSALHELRPHPPARARYESGPLIGRGGMGEVHKARDLELDRYLALKKLHRSGPRARQRFLREATLTGRLDHPGVVPVHDLGTDADGQPFFTMKHVEGVDLDEVIRRVHARDPEWGLTRALEVLIKVCDTVAFAHSRGIVHRDLKPSNVRVGRFGEVFVMDWGLARVQGEEGLDAQADDTSTSKGEPSDALTLDGDVLGTPAYMAPEQAEGRNAAVGKPADVYALGAMLYQLLSGERPYGSAGEPRSSTQILALVRTRPPEPLRTTAASAPIELIAIAEKAMQREPAQRYPEMEAVARDLRAFLDRRVVSAHRAGTIERTLKWARRNRSVVIPAAVVLGAAALGAWLYQRGRAEDRQRLVQLSRRHLVAAFDTLGPSQPSNEVAYAHWVAQAEELLESRERDATRLEELKSRALPLDREAPAERAELARRAERARLLRRLVRDFQSLLEAIDRGEKSPPQGLSRDWVALQVKENWAHLERERAQELPHLTYRFADEEDQVLFEALSTLCAEQEELLATRQAFAWVDLARWGVAAARRVDGLSLARSAEWEQARRSIADPAQCPAYRGFELAPQLGLVPIGRDPDSGLWEFAHVLSGEVPERGSDGRLRIDEGSAIVLVLIPGGTLLRGSQNTDSSAANFDPWSEANAAGPDEVELEPFFLSKYELTLAQWLRVTGRNPHQDDRRIGCDAGTLFPLEHVDFNEARRFLAVLGLVLPSEAQWEWGARAGTCTPWSTGAEQGSIAGHANVLGNNRAVREFVNVNELEPAQFDDGFLTLAPVGSFRPNAFGLHDTMGNVREWCRDTGIFAYSFLSTRIETGERINRDEGLRVARGGSFATSVVRCRSAARDPVGPRSCEGDLGLRPAREVER